MHQNRSSGSFITRRWHTHVHLCIHKYIHNHTHTYIRIDNRIPSSQGHSTRRSRKTSVTIQEEASLPHTRDHDSETDISTDQRLLRSSQILKDSETDTAAADQRLRWSSSQAQDVRGDEDATVVCALRNKGLQWVAMSVARRVITAEVQECAARRRSHTATTMYAGIDGELEHDARMYDAKLSHLRTGVCMSVCVSVRRGTERERET